MSSIDAHLTDIADKTFADCHKIRESFLHRKFPAIRYMVFSTNY